MCQSQRKFGKAKCPDGAVRNVNKLEHEIMRHVDSLLVNPERIRAQQDAAIAEEITRNPDEDAIGWLRMVEECDRERAAYQDQQAAGYMALEELGSKLAELEERKATARNELDRLREGKRRVEALEATKRMLPGAYREVLVYDGIWYFPPEVRREIYEAIRLTATVPTKSYSKPTPRTTPRSNTDGREGTLERIRGFFAPSPLHTATFVDRQVLDYDGLRGRLRSSSYVPAEGRPGYREMMGELERCFRDYEDGGRVVR